VPRTIASQASRQREALAVTIGNDGWQLLTAIYQTDAPTWLREVPAVDMLRRMWIQNFQWDGSQVCWRASDSIPPAATFISSPYDPEAHYARKHTTQWVGYKVVLTETCADDLPHLITNVETTAGPVADGDVTPSSHAALQERKLLPQTHSVDTGFLDAALLVESHEQYGVDLFGPTRLDYHWQAREQTGYAAAQFHSDWQQQHATCLEGKTSISWTPAVDKRTNEVITITFSTKDCRHCPQLTQCVRSKKRYPRRTITIRREQQHQALQAARQREGTKAFQKEYDRRAKTRRSPFTRLMAGTGAT
jgi:transposase